MTGRNLEASVHARLQNHARATKQPFQELLLATQYAFDGELLAKAIAATFANRETGIDAAPIAFTPDFTEQASTLAQWTAFRNKLPNAQCPEKISEVVSFLSDFLVPVARACRNGELFELRWTPRGPWDTYS
jgi:hypothetical protein